MTIYDRAFILTIPRAAGRLAATQEHLRAVGIDADPFFGVDGTTMGLETAFTYEVDHPGSGYKIGPKHIAMYLGHYMLWKTLTHMPGDSFLVLEDDARFVSNWRAHVDFVWPQMPENWDIIYLGSCCAEGAAGARQLVAGQLFKVKYALCTHAYLIRKKALPIFLEQCERVYAPVDIAMALHCLPKVKAYAFLPRLAEQEGTELAR